MESTKSHTLAIVPAKSAADCAYDIVSMGEIMLRLDPGEQRIRTTRSFTAWDSGAEYNVARAFRRCFGLRGAIVTAFADNEVGRLLEDFMLASGLDTDFIHWATYDGVGRSVRNGLNFSERGFGIRGAVGCPDRGNSAISQLRPQDIDFEEIFVRRGARWFHTGGIMAGLSDQAVETTAAAMKAARAAGTIVSYDLNYRPSLWQAIGGVARCQEVNRELARYVDVMVGNEEDFTACLGLEVAGNEQGLGELEVDSYRAMIDTASAHYPNLLAIGTTLRTVHSASDNDWGAIAWSRARGFSQATPRPHLAIMDRLGGGDSFASGFFYGLLELDDLDLAVQYGAANGAMAMTTPGDTTTATLAELTRLVQGGNARVQR